MLTFEMKPLVFLDLDLPETLVLPEMSTEPNNLTVCLVL